MVEIPPEDPNCTQPKKDVLEVSVPAGVCERAEVERGAAVGRIRECGVDQTVNYGLADVDIVA